MGCSKNGVIFSDCHGRDHVTHAELVVKSDGTVTGLKVDTIANLVGRILQQLHQLIYMVHWCQVCIIFQLHINVKAVYINIAPADAYRGAKRPEATYMIERLMSKAATELGMDCLLKKILLKNFHINKL